MKLVIGAVGVISLASYYAYYHMKPDTPAATDVQNVPKAVEYNGSTSSGDGVDNINQLTSSHGGNIGGMVGRWLVNINEDASKAVEYITKAL